MGRTRQEIDWQESAEELYDHYRAERDVQRRKRLQVLWLVRQGRTATAAATEAGVGVRTVLRWLDWYRAAGLAEVLRRVPGHGARGAACWLSRSNRLRCWLSAAVAPSAPMARRSAGSTGSSRSPIATMASTPC